MKLDSGAGVGDSNDRRSNNDTIGFPADARFWESVIAMPRFVGKKLTEVKLYPITLGFKKPRPQRGWPMLANPELSKKIIDDVTKFSAPFGTRIEFKDGIGLVGIGATRSDRPCAPSSRHRGRRWRPSAPRDPARSAGRRFARGCAPSTDRALPTSRP